MTLLCAVGYAQDLSFNVKAGLNLSTYMGEDADYATVKPGVRVGVGLDYAFSDMVSLQPSLFFSQKGAKYDASLESYSSKADITIDQMYLELPINLQFRINLVDNTNLIIATGPYLAYGVGGKTKIGADILSIIPLSTKIDTFGDLGLNRFDAGWNLDFGLEFGQFLVGLNAQVGFCNLMDDLSYGGIVFHDTSLRNASFGVNIGYKF